MATLNNFVMSYVLMQNTNVKSPVKDRWFAKVNRTGNITTRGLAEYLITLGVALDRSDVEKVLIKLAQAVPGIVAQGYGVKIPGLGIFYPTIANKKGGADSVDDFSVTKNIDGVRFRFRPDSTDLDNLTTKAFGRKVSFTDLDNLTTKAFGRKVSFGNGYYKESAGKRAPLIPLAAANQEP